MYLAKKYGIDKWTVIHPGGFLALQEPRGVVLQLLRAAGVEDAESVLTPVTPSVWRAAFISATAAEANAAREAVEQAASLADVELVRRNQAKIESALATLTESVTAFSRETDIAKLRAHQEAEYRRLVAAHGFEPNEEGQAMFRAHLATTAVGRLLASLEAANENSA